MIGRDLTYDIIQQMVSKGGGSVRAKAEPGQRCEGVKGGRECVAVGRAGMRGFTHIDFNLIS